MNRALKFILYPMLNKRKHSSDGELNKYVLMLALSVLTCILHAALAVFFAVENCMPLVAGHVAGLLVFLVAARLIACRYYDLAGALLSLSILVTSVQAVYCVGGDTYAVLYQITVLLMAVVAASERRVLLAAASVLLPLLMVATYLLEAWHTPGYDLAQAKTFLAVFTILFNALGIAALLSLQRSLHAFLAAYEKQRLQLLESQAYRDALTGLHNRRYADLYFERLTANPPECGVCVALGDLDDFKTVNDVYGHEAGDLVLKTVAAILQEGLRKSDLVCRWGGEELLLVIQDASLQNTYLLLEKIREKVAMQRINHNGRTLSVSITFGAAELDGNNIADSLECCDKNLYRGKLSGKNQIVF